MMHRVSQPGGWSPGRLGLVMVILFILQVGLIWSFAERERKAGAPKTTDFVVRLLPESVEPSQLATALFAQDPTLFQAPGRRGFSGRAWMDGASPEYREPKRPSPGIWLALAATNWQPPLLTTGGQEELPAALEPPRATEFEPTGILLEPDGPPPGSGARVEGTLARRQLLTPLTNLPAQAAQANGELAGKSQVQIAVDPAGLVISARLMGSSGVPAADTVALARARALRFAPSADGSGGEQWGTLIYSWKTTEDGTAK